MNLPLKPTAIVNFKTVDNQLANIDVNSWEYTWSKKNPAIDMKTKLHLSLSNAVGAGRFRQASFGKKSTSCYYQEQDE
jgi:hypothetical protein